MTSVNEEKFLEEIYYSVRQNGYARVSHLAKSLKVPVSTASKMIGKLTQEEYINYQPYGIITLTEEGLRKGKALAAHHMVLFHFFRYIGMEEDKIDQEVRKVEYHFSDEAITYIKNFLIKRNFFKPTTLE